MTSKKAKKAKIAKTADPRPKEGVTQEAGLLPHVPFQHTSLWKYVREGKFPKPTKWGSKTLWRWSDVNRWFEALEAANDAGGE